MDLQTLYIIVASVALAVALESIIFQLWSFKKMNRQIDALREYLRGARCERQERRGNSGEWINNSVGLTGNVGLPEDLIAESREREAESGKRRVESGERKEALLKQAYDTFYMQYQQVVSGINAENINEKRHQQAALLLEMGYWLKDFLPVWAEDFNATQLQKNNVESIGQSEQQWRDEVTRGGKPTTNPMETPYEAIALTQQLREWGVKEFRFLISGFSYQP